MAGTSSPALATVGAMARCVAATLTLLSHGRLRQPLRHRGRILGFADGTAARVFRETRVAGAAPLEPCVLLVTFRLRAVRGRGHLLFERVSLLNTLLFAGFPGFVSKLWIGHDDAGCYRGLYEWDGADRAEEYVAALSRVLGRVSVPGSVTHRVLPGVRRDEVLADPARSMTATPEDAEAWWRLVAA